MMCSQSQFEVRHSYRVAFSRQVFKITNPLLPEILSSNGQRNRVLLVIDSNVASKHPQLPGQIATFAAHLGDLLDLVAPPFVMTGGEACKNDPDEVLSVLSLINKHRMCRHSVVMVIGGGAVLDACGFAAATAHRGLRLVRLPTTTLAQNDAGVGVKNGVNLFGKKNFVGTFSPPLAVVNDLDFLDTLEPRDLRSGIAEAVKVALLKDADFFEFLYERRERLRDFEPQAMEQMIVRCAELHIEHIQTNGDPFETGSSRPLDFGHWTAHKIEELSGYEVRHGEAVAVGIALDTTYAALKGLISSQDLNRIIQLLEDVGFELFHPALLEMDIPSAISDFREHMGGDLVIPLIHPIGTLMEARTMDEVLINESINVLSSRHCDRRNDHDYFEMPDDRQAGA